MSRRRSSIDTRGIRLGDHSYRTWDAGRRAPGDHHLLFLERAFPHLSEEEQATYLQYAWQRLQGHESLELALGLFHQAKIDREVALRFAWRLFPRARHPVDYLGFVPIGCLGSATVRRQDVIAYFMAQPAEPDLAGRELHVNDEDYHEDECIIDCDHVGQIEYQQVEDPYKDERVGNPRP